MSHVSMRQYPSKCTLRIISLLVLGGMLLSACAEQPWSPTPHEARTWVSTLGEDTVAVEQFTVTESVISGVLIERTPETHVIAYEAELNDSGHIITFELRKSTPSANPDGPDPLEWSTHVQDTVATVVRTVDVNPGEVRASVPPGVIPYLGQVHPSMYVFSQAFDQARRGAQEIHLLGRGGSASCRSLVYSQPHEFSLDLFGSPITAVLDADGQLIGTSGAATVAKREVRRVKPYDIMPSAARWAAMDVAGEGVGTPSPGATASGTVDGAFIEVRYSRPAMRGRDIWGRLVPYDEVWRTGANAATHLTTDHDLTIGGHVLPAGTYTLWSLYTETGGEFIVNAQTNQWGTFYNEEHDLFRVKMTPSATPEPIERFTISIRDTDAGGELVLAWDTTEWIVPLTVD